MPFPWRGIVAAASVLALIHCGDGSTAPKTVTVAVTTNQQSILPGQSVVATIEVTPEGLVLRELAPGVSVEYVQDRTEPRLVVPADIREMRQPEPVPA